MLDVKKLYRWCSIPADELINHPDRRVPLRIVPDAQALGEIMALDFASDINNANKEARKYHAIVPCGPKEWYAPFARIVNEQRISLKNVVTFHMDENLDWNCNLLNEEDPSNFGTFMRRYFYETVDPELAILPENRNYLLPENFKELSKRILETEIDYTLGGWGQDGHLAFNQARRNPYVYSSIDDIRNSTAHIRENNIDTILALSHRGFGAAWQFMPPMCISLGPKECLKARKIRVYSATGAWKQTALRIALFSEPTPEYPMTLLQEHRDALITASAETTEHPFAQNPQWRFNGVNV
jgi:glucosamine-6-phosphate deaminase